MTSYPQIDYTSRDFVSLVQDMTALIPQRVPEWTDRSMNDFGMALIELFAYQGDILSYYGDRIANESYLSTATQRESVLMIARLLDYSPTGPIAASVGLTFSNSSGSSAWVLKGTQVATAAQNTAAPNPSKPFQTYQLASHAPVYFETTADLLVPANGSATVTAIEGTTYNELTGTSTGAADQDFQLFRSPVIDNSVTVSVGSTKWVYYERLVDAYPTTRAYTLETDGDGNVHVIFGDNSNGAIPPVGSSINATYRVGGGKRGNVAAQKITRIISTVPSGVRVINPAAAVGGGNAETIESIKANAPRALFALQRAISLADYIGLALRVGGVAKANVAPPAVYSQVTMYIAPTGGGGINDDGTPTPAFTQLKQRVQHYLSDKIPLGTTLTMADPAYVPVQINMEIQVKPKYKQDDVHHAAVKVLVALFDFENVVFGDTITLKDVHTALATVPGIQKINSIELTRDAPPVIDVERFESVPSGSGWTLDSAVWIQGPTSVRRQGAGTAFRTFAALDLSAMDALSMRFTWTAPSKQSVATTITFTDTNGNTHSLGTKSPTAPSLATGNWITARWPIEWPDDITVFDPAQIVRWDMTFAPSSGIANSRRFWIDMLLAYVDEAEDIVLAPYELPATFGPIGDPYNSHITVAATGGLLRG